MENAIGISNRKWNIASREKLELNALKKHQNDQILKALWVTFFSSSYYCRSLCVAHLAIDLGWWCPVTALLTAQCLSDRHLQDTDWTLSLTKCCKSSLNSCSSIAEPWGKIAREVERAQLILAESRLTSCPYYGE